MGGVTSMWSALAGQRGKEERLAGSDAERKDGQR